MYQIKVTKLFNSRLTHLRSLFNLSNDETKYTLDNIKFSMKELQHKGKLPDAYDDHKLIDDPWKGFNEFHVLDDVLVVYYKVEKKKTIRFVTILSHKDLHNGKI